MGVDISIHGNMSVKKWKIQPVLESHLKTMSRCPVLESFSKNDPRNGSFLSKNSSKNKWKFFLMMLECIFHGFERKFSKKCNTTSPISYATSESWSQTKKRPCQRLIRRKALEGPGPRVINLKTIASKAARPRRSIRLSTTPLRHRDSILFKFWHKS